MGFESYHPAMNLIYFVSVLTGTILFPHPIFLGISYLCAFLYCVKRRGWKALIFNLCLIPLVVVFALYYASYHHFGLTVLGHNFIGNNLTVESFVYGLFLGFRVITICMWLSCMFTIFTADKVVYLFGTVSPILSLFLSILLRMVPRCKLQWKKLSTARQAIGRGTRQGNLLQRIRNWIRLFSMTITWLLESMSTISDSMRSRGHGLRGRTAFSIYRFDHRDRSFVIAIFACITVTVMGHLLNQTTFYFAPTLIMNPITALSYGFYAGYLCLCILPMAVEIFGEWSFRRSRKAALL